MGTYGEEIDFIGKEYSMPTKLSFLAKRLRFSEEMNISSLNINHLATKFEFPRQKATIGDELSFPRQKATIGDEIIFPCQKPMIW